MTAIGGSPVEATFDGRGYGCVADSDPKVVRGGKVNEVKPLGNGKAILIQKNNAWMLNSLVVAIDNESDDLGYLQDLANRKGFWPVTFEEADGTIVSGSGQIEGEIGHDVGSGTATINLKGEGQLAP